MSDDYQRIELITGAVRRRHWTTEQKLQIIEDSFQPGETVSSVADGAAKSASVSLSGCLAAKRWSSKFPGGAGEVGVKKTELAALVAAV